jgi:hypothetical protein
MTDESGTSVPDRLHTACPHCGKRFATSWANQGKRARCPGCSQTFLIEESAETADPAAVPAPTAAAVVPAAAAATAPAAQISAPAAAAATDVGRLCAICQSPFAPEEATCACPDCNTPYHQECWDYNQGCAVYGCEQTPVTEGLSDLEVPAAYWGKEEKECPRCKKTILAAATRCRYCGATFSSATPQGSKSYQAQQKAKAKLPAVRTFSLWLLVFSLLTCTAPIAAIVGLIWYFSNRDTIRILPSLNAAMCKIAVGVAWFQTCMIVLFAVIHQLLSG